jgi:hypothetical protein
MLSHVYIAWYKNSGKFGRSLELCVKHRLWLGVTQQLSTSPELPHVFISGYMYVNMANVFYLLNIIHLSFISYDFTSTMTGVNE